MSILHRMRRGGAALVVSASITLAAGSVVVLAALNGGGTLLRNAVLLMEPPGSSFDWSPSDAPATFLRDAQPAPARFRSLAESLTVGGTPGVRDDFATAVNFARFIGENPRRGGAIRGSSAEALTRIRGDGEGYCADYTQVFMALANAASLTSREWGFGVERFGAAHAFNEVYSTRLKQWVFIDAFNGFYVTDAVTGRPLSATEFRARLADSAAAGLRVVAVSDSAFNFKSEQNALNYFREGANYFYLFWGNTVHSYDASGLVNRLGSVSRTAEIIGAAAAGLQPRVVPLRTDSNAAAVAELARLRLAMLAALVFGLATALQVARRLRVTAS